MSRPFGTGFGSACGGAAAGWMAAGAAPDGALCASGGSVRGGRGIVGLGAEQRRQGGAQHLGPRQLDLLRRSGGRSRRPIVRQRAGRRRLRTVALPPPADGRLRNHSGSLPSLRASTGLGAPLGAAAAGFLSSGASRSAKSSSCAAPLIGPFSAPASRADRRPSRRRSVSAGGAASGAACVCFGAPLRAPPEASPPSPDRLLRIEARISSRLLAPAASGLLIPHLTPMPHPASRSPRTRLETAWRTHCRPHLSIAEACALHQRAARQRAAGGRQNRRIRAGRRPTGTRYFAGT